ncbi:MAG TPA: Tc toxin subunit A [Pseudomonas sp.]|uniref:Tc toxin subunit A n=1 Tax=Pseudomonas sp. TaxID=306 RepID=UPI002B6F006A|nr:Tc toxin subunit A [Pseudomonas sp.]HWH89001.1 Tc toxin subunit A [Pseudomonas sp.]
MNEIEPDNFKKITNSAGTDSLEIYNTTISSVLDVIRQSKQQYKNTLKDSDSKLFADKIHDYASSVARQITREQMERQLHKTESDRNKRDLSVTEASYNNLFKENWGIFCAQNDIAAIDSPAAYLRALYIFAGQLDADEKNERKIDTLRPDISEQKIDAASVFESIPALQLVNAVLAKKIQNHPLHARDKEALEIMSKQTKPLHFPYHHQHRRCVAALATKNERPGILDYKLQLDWPDSFFQKSIKANLLQHCNTQIKMSSLGKRQIDVLTARLAEYTSPTDPQTGAANSVVDRSEIKNGCYDLDRFASQTNCAPAQIKQLLELQITKSYPSHDSFLVVTDIPNSEQKRISLTYQNADAHMFTALDRLQRMIRLHRWTDISLEELDVLVCSATLGKNIDTFITNSTLSALGVYQYFNQRCGIEAEEFAALLYRLPTRPINGRTSLFDRVFQRNLLAANPFKHETGSIEASPALLADGLNIQITQDSFGFIARLTKKHLGKFHQNLISASSIYRQARVAQLFGLSPLECHELADLLGGEAFERLLVTGQSGDEGEPDFLHLLMALDGVMTWLRSAGLTAAQLLRMLGRRLPFARETLPAHLAAIRATRHTTEEEPQILAIQQLLQDVAGLSAQYVPCVMKMVGTNEQSLDAQIRDGKNLLVNRSLAAAEICQALNISSDALLTLLNTPDLLKAQWQNVFQLPELYCLERFANYSRRDENASEKLLGYLSSAQTVQSKDANDALRDLLAVERPLDILTSQLPKSHVENMQQLDWIIRHLDVSTRTGLSLKGLRDLLKLNDESSMKDWSIVAAELLPGKNV